MTAKSPDTSPLKIALFPGSFDPFTLGHLSVLQRALPLFDRVIIVVGINTAKPGAHSPDERIQEIQHIIASHPQVSVIAWEGLTVDLARREGAQYIIRGARTAADFDYEYNLATINRELAGIETIIIPTLPTLAHVSSSLVRELNHFGHDTTPYLPSL